MRISARLFQPQSALLPDATASCSRTKRPGGDFFGVSRALGSDSLSTTGARGGTGVYISYFSVVFKDSAEIFYFVRRPGEPTSLPPGQQ